MAYTPDISQMRSAYAQQLAEQQRKALRGVQDIFAQRGTTGGGEEALALGETGRQYGLGAGTAEAALQQYLGGLGEQQRQFDINQALAQQQFGLQQELGRGQLGLGQQQFGLQQELGRGNLGLSQQQLAQQGQQFGQSLAEQQRQANLTNQLAQAQLAQQGTQFGQSLGEQQRQYNLANQLAQGQFGLQQAELYGGGQYGGLYTPTQSALQQKFAQNLSLLPYITQGYLSPEQAFGTSRVINAGGRGFSQVPNRPFGQITTEQQLSPEYSYAQQLGMNPYQLALLSQTDPAYLANIIKTNYTQPNYGINQANLQNQIRNEISRQKPIGFSPWG